MKRFPYAHATHPQWPMAASLVLAQLRAQMAQDGYSAAPTLGLLYITDHFATVAQPLLDFLGAELPHVTDWSGTVGTGIAAAAAEYWDEPAMAVMLLDLPSDQYRVFSGVSPLGMGFEAHSALVHADAQTADLAELVQEMAARTDSGFLFGGLSSSRERNLQFALAADGNISGHGAAGGVFTGGLSGVAFGPGVGLLSRVTQGCKPISRAHTVTRAEHNVILALDDQPALDVLLQDLDVSLDHPQEAIDAMRMTLVGLTPADVAPVHQTGNLGHEVTVRSLIGLDSGRRGIALAEAVPQQARLAFCRRNAQAARADLMRICAEIREELESAEPAPAGAAGQREIAGALYVSCLGRGAHHFGGPSAELQLVRHALGDVPLVGFFAAGEIAHDRLYTYTGVLTVFTTAA